MELNIMTTILVTHTDLDGAGCAILFKRQFPDIEIEYHDYDTIDDISKELWDNRNNYDQIFFADITPNEEIGRKMVNDDKFILIDHHITRTYLADLPNTNVIYDTTICATRLVAHYFGVANEYDADYNDNWKFIFAVDAYDTWKLNSLYREHGLDLNLLFSYYGMDEFVTEFSNMDVIDSYERTILTVLKRLDSDYLTEKLNQGVIKQDNNGNKYFEVYVCGKGGHIGVLVDDPRFPGECLYVKTINLNDKVVGLYSKDFDVSEIAKSHGGGGHPGAAGYQI